MSREAPNLNVAVITANGQVYDETVVRTWSELREQVREYVEFIEDANFTAGWEVRVR